MKSKLLFLSITCVTVAIIFKIFISDISFDKVLKLVKNNGVKLSNHKNGIFTKDQLKLYNGIIKKKLYISILGTVYDVTKMEKHYGPGKTYHVFTGRDASKSFITGNFNENEISDDVSDLTPEELLSLKQWKQFYDERYTKKGILTGRYYNVDGSRTQYYNEIHKLFENAEKQKLEKNPDEQEYPPCNIEWNAETGTRVWCSNKSGGISRDWIGYPRKYYKLGSDSHRCACINKIEGKNAKIKEYEDCDKQSVSCFIETD